MSRTLYRRFCENVRSGMEERDWSQDDLAAKMRVTKGYVSNLLNGRAQPGLHTLEKVAKAFRVDPSELLSEKELIGG